jgi:glycine cleavage system transcriptional repressor
MAGSKSFVVLTAVGPDRPGVVSEISRTIHAAGCNLEDSRMAILGGEFALILLCSGPAEATRLVEQRARALAERLGLGCIVKPTSPPPEPRGAVTCSLRVSGIDRPGIVHGVTGLLAARAVNVASLESRVVPAPESGTPIFQLSAELHVPGDVSVAALRDALVERCEKDGLDVTIEEMA